MTAAPLPPGCERAQATVHSFPGACAAWRHQGICALELIPPESTGPAPGCSTFSAASSDEGIPCPSPACLLRMCLSPA